MAKKFKIDIDFNQDNSLIGISCHKKDYWIAFQLNELLHINLRRFDDLCVYKSQQEIQLFYPLFYYTDTDSLINYYFFSNHNQEGKLFPAQKTIDYFLLINGLISENKLIEPKETYQKDHTLYLNNLVHQHNFYIQNKN